MDGNEKGGRPGEAGGWWQVPRWDPNGQLLVAETSGEPEPPPPTSSSATSATPHPTSHLLFSAPPSPSNNLNEASRASSSPPSSSSHQHRNKKLSKSPARLVKKPPCPATITKRFSAKSEFHFVECRSS